MNLRLKSNEAFKELIIQYPADSIIIILYIKEYFK
jgi:hypothetical protein